MNTRDDGGSVYPQTIDNYSSGMSLRDWFAGQAMNAALVTASAASENLLPQMFEMLARCSYQAADAMLAVHAEFLELGRGSWGREYAATVREAISEIKPPCVHDYEELMSKTFFVYRQCKRCGHRLAA